MNFYQILGAKKQTSDKEIRLQYLKAAKKYHPDVYSGINEDHFKRVNDAYQTLKNPAKRDEYDRKMKFKASKANEKENDGSSTNDGEPFVQPEHTMTRDQVDPEFEQAFNALNTQKLFNEFMARPILSDPEELNENLMQPEYHVKMSKRDKARKRFIQEFRLKQKIKNSYKEIIREEYINHRSVMDGEAEFDDLNYKQLVERISQEDQVREAIDQPLMLFKEEKQMVAAIEKEKIQILKDVKKVWYPLWSAAIVINSVLLVAYYKQEALITKNQAKIDNQNKMEANTF